MPIKKYIEFSKYTLIGLTTILLFTYESNYFYQNFIISLFILFNFLFLISGSLRNNDFFYFIYKNFNYIDGLFFIDFIYNFLGIFYSTYPRGATEEVFYQLIYFLTYLIVRVISLYSLNEQKTFYTLYSIIFSLFAGKISYIVFYKFQMISTDGRITYSSLHPNIVASILIAGASFLVYQIIKILYSNIDNLWTPSSLIKLLPNLIIFLALGFLILLTSSRGGMLGYIFGTLLTIFYIYYNYSKKINFKYPLIFLAGFLIFSYIVFPNHFERVQSIFQLEHIKSAGARSHIWKAAIDLYLKYPIFGVGPGAANYSVQEITKSVMVDMHNFILEKACNGGIVGLIIFLAPLFLIAKKALNKLNQLDFKSNPQNAAVNLSLLFLLIGVFTNSSFSPHFVMPLISITLYSFIAIAVTNNSPAQQNFEISVINNYMPGYGLPITAIIFIIISFIFKILQNTTDYFFYNELVIFYKASLILIIGFIYFFYVYNSTSKLINIEKTTNENNNLFKLQLLNTLTIALFLIIIFIFSKGFNFYVAERANSIGISYALKYSANKAINFFDIAFKNDPDQIAYMLNRSNITFIKELTLGNKLKGNPNLKDALDLALRYINAYQSDEMLRSNYALIKNKYEGLSSEAQFKTVVPNSNTIEVNVTKLDSEMALQVPDNAFSKFADIFKDKAYEKYIAANNILKQEMLDIINKEKIIKHGTNLSKYFNYITMTLRFCLNIDLPAIDNFLINGVSAAFVSTDSAAKYIPLKEFKEKSIQYTQQNEIISSIFCILPAAWKYNNKMANEEIKQNFLKYFGSEKLFYIIDYFLLQNENAANEFKNLEPQLQAYLKSMELFSSSKFNEAKENQEQTFQKFKALGQSNSILLSWIYYKAGEIKKAHEMAYFTQSLTLNASRRDFIYKRDLLYTGNLLPFYYLPVQSYYNEFIMLALLKLNKGNHTKILPEVFNYLRQVIYNN